MNIKKNIIIACTGSVATIKLPLIIESLKAAQSPFDFQIKVVLTPHAKHFVDLESIRKEVEILDEESEWSSWNQRGDPVLHIDLIKWADILLIAPLSANSLGKIASGICDNLLLCIVRAWDISKPLLFCPAMNTKMYEHPITNEQIMKLSKWGYYEIPSISKTLMCGDTGIGAMADVNTIIEEVFKKLSNL